MIKNAIIYNVEMPTAAEMHVFAQANPVNKPSAQGRITTGFAKHPITGDLVSLFEGGYCVTILIWEKKIDAAAIREEMNEKIAQFESQEGRFAKKSEKESIRDEIVLTLLPHILPSPKYVYCYVDLDSDTLLIDTASEPVAEKATALLRKAIGSLKATTVYIDHRIGLTACFAGALDAGTRCLIDDNTRIKIADRLELEGIEGGKVKYTDVDLLDETTAEEICAQIREGGMSVKSINLTDQGVAWQLTDGFKFKSIKFPDWEDENIAEFKEEEWYSETFYAMEKLVDISTQIADAFTVVEK